MNSTPFTFLKVSICPGLIFATAKIIICPAPSGFELFQLLDILCCDCILKLDEISGQIGVRVMLDTSSLKPIIMRRSCSYNNLVAAGRWPVRPAGCLSKTEH